VGWGVKDVGLGVHVLKTWKTGGYHCPIRIVDWMILL
jgi:hypothetical protein